MNDRELLEKLLSHVVDLTQDMAEVKSKLSTVADAVTRIENVHGEKLSVLFDARELQNDINEKITAALNRIEAKVDLMAFNAVSIRRTK